MDLKQLKDKVREFKKIHCMPLNKPKAGSKHYTEALGKMTPKQYLQHIINDIMPKHGDHPKEVKMVMKEVKEVKKGGNVWIRFLNEHESEKRDGEDRKDFLKRMAVVYHGMKGKPEKKVKKEEKKEKKPEKKSKTEEAMVAREKMLKEAGFDTDFMEKKAKKAKRASSPKSPKAKKIKEAKKHIEKAKEVLKNA
jgi:hypothetical protein